MATFTIYWCCITAAYVVILGLFKMATKEASDRDYGMLQVCYKQYPTPHSSALFVV